jgi:hypothetical protein
LVATIDRVPVVPPLSPRRRRGGLAAIAIGVVALGVAVPVYQRGVSAGTFPPWVPGTSDYVVNRYSGPWIMGAFGLVVLAVIAFAVAYSRLRRPPALPPSTYPAVSWPLMQVTDAPPAPVVAVDPALASPADPRSPWARPA